MTFTKYQAYPYRHSFKSEFVGSIRSSANMIKWAEKREQITRWLDDQQITVWIEEDAEFMFMNEKDAMAFILRWS